ncbi:uncharacterized protein [Primulina eburnea]|uniref:uncharacterized protein n=1 Tax=Primulina eburnea TaxID=1245227 RepID=UPI003C6BE692
MIDAASGGALVNKTPQEARALISNMAANTQQFGIRQDNPPRQVNEVSVTPIDQKLDSLTSLLERLVAGQVQQIRVRHNKKNPCNKPMRLVDFLGSPSIDMTHILIATIQDGGIIQISAIRINEANRDIHSRIVTNNTHQNKHPTQETRASIQNLSTQVGQLATSIHKLEAQNLGNKPSQIVVNPREIVSAITLRNCKELDVQEIGVQASIKQKEENEIKVEDKIINQDDASKGKFSPLFEYKPIPPFPLALNRKCESIKELNDTLCRCEVNIPSIDAIKPVPRCAKILKELCTTKKRHKLKGCKKEKVGEHVSAFIQKIIPIKCSDPGMFSVSCTIGDTRLEKAKLDLGA